MDARKEAELHMIVKEFYNSACISREKDSPVTVAEVNQLAAKLAQTLDSLISKL